MKTNNKQGAVKTVLEVINVSVSSGTNNETSDARAFEVLQDAGFVGLKYAANRTTARPPGGDKTFLLEYDSSNPANRKPFKLVCLSYFCKEIEIGTTLYVPNVIGGVPMFPLKFR